MKQCKFIVPPRWYEKRHRCPFKANAGDYCKRHAIVYARTGSNVGHLPRPASYWELKYRELLGKYILCLKENDNLCKRLSEK